MKNGETLYQYCLKNGLCYNSIYYRIEKSGALPDDAVVEYLPHKGRKDQAAKYFVDGRKLTSYTGGSKTLLYARVLQFMYRKKLTPKDALIRAGVTL